MKNKRLIAVMAFVSLLPFWTMAQDVIRLTWEYDGTTTKTVEIQTNKILETI